MDSGEKGTETMSDNDAGEEKFPERQTESLPDRQQILQRADSAFYATAQTFLSEFEAEALDENGQPDLYATEVAA